MKLLSTCLLLTLTTFGYAQEDVTDSIANAVEASLEEENYDSDLIEPGSLPSETQYQSEKLTIRKFDKDEWKKIVGEVNFEEKAPEKRIASQPPMQAAPWAGAALKILAYLLVIAIVIFIIYFLVRNTTTGPVKAKEGVQAYSFVTPEDDLSDFDMEEMIRKARSAGDMNMVVRAYYLGLLKRLHNGGMVHWKKDKTNFDYLMELLAKNYYYDEIRKLTLAYEGVWYGERMVSPDSFEQITQDFERMHEQLARIEPK